MLSTAIYGLISKISAMNIIKIISNSFTMFSAVLKGGIAGGLAIASEGATALTVALSASLPVIFGVVAAVALLMKGAKALQDSMDYELQVSKLQDMEEEYANIQAKIEELDSYNGDLTQSEQKELELLREQTAELERQIQLQKDKIGNALSADVQNAITGFEVKQDDPALDPYFVTYNKLERDFQNLLTQAQEEAQGSRAYQASVEEFIDAYGDLADRLVDASKEGKELNETELQMVTTVSMARAELEYLTETYGDLVFTSGEATDYLSDYIKNISTLPDKLQSATDALQKFKDATSTDYSAPIEGYQEAFKTLSSELESGTANIDQVRAGVELYLPEGTLESVNYNLEAAAELLGEAFSGKLGTVLSAEDPLGGLVQVIQESGSTLKTQFGEIAAEITDDGNLTIRSYSMLADALGTSTEIAEGLGLAIQDQSSKFFFTTEEILQMKNALANVGKISEITEDNIGTLVSTISAVAETTDPVEIQAWVDAMKEIGSIDASVEVTASGINDALAGVEEVDEAVEDVPEEKATTITAVVNGLENVEDLASAVSGIYSKTATISTNIRLMVNGQYISLDEFKQLGLGKFVSNAKGTDYAAGGLSLVNDGVPVNGSSAELIVEGNSARIANGGKIGITHLERGAKVYNAAETQEILKNSQNGRTDLGALLSGIQAFPTGTSKFDVNKYLNSTVPSNYSPTASGTISPTSSDPTTRKEEFDNWLREKKHYLAMDMITEAEYYRDLEIMNERYLAGQEEYLDEYWRHQEEIYEYQKRDLQDIVELEEKLNNLAKAKTQKVLVYKDGMFQYIQNTEAIAKAQRAVTGYANGTTHATAGVHKVGENGAELRVLNEGDGIIPSNITRNLMTIGSMGLSGLSKLGNNEINNFNIQNVNLEKINNVDELFAGLKNLAMQATTARA